MPDNSEQRICQNCKQNFIIEPDDFDFYEKIKVPVPTFCPECRLIRRLAWLNENSLYKRNCDLCGKPMISVFSKESGLKVYCSPCWWSDKWDGLEYGIDFDLKRPFLLQVRELLQKVPVMNLFSLYSSLENSEYTNMVGNLKNCYMVFHSDANENCFYGGQILNTKDSVDNLLINGCELCYENVNCRNCYQTFFSLNCADCDSVYFSRDCSGCSNCLGCVNLRNKKYYIFNKPYTKEDYEIQVKSYLPDSSVKIEDMQRKAFEFWKKFPQKYIHEKHNNNVSGDYIYNSKNTLDSYIVDNVENSRFCAFTTPPSVKDCYDFTHYGSNAELLYDSIQVGNQASRVYFSWFAITGIREVEYSMFNIGCRNIFGSVGLKKREFCILNKQYSETDYEKLRTEIIKQMNKQPHKDKKGNRYPYGEFFPIEMSPFGYNETRAQQFFPLTKQQAQEQGYSWKPPEPRNYQITIKSQDLPDNIKDVDDSILKEIIECAHQGQCQEQCTEAFRIIPQELAFYRRMNLPLPRLCPNCRHYQRLKQRNPLRLWKRQCQAPGCSNTFETSYAPDRPEIVYCEECYLKEVV